MFSVKMKTQFSMIIALHYCYFFDMH